MADAATKPEPLDLEPHPFAESYGWRKPHPKARPFDPTKPLYVWKAQGGGIWVGDEFVKRGEVVPAHLIEVLGFDRVKLMHWVRELDHAPVPGIEPRLQTFTVAPGEHVSVRPPEQQAGRRKAR